MFIDGCIYKWKEKRVFELRFVISYWFMLFYILNVVECNWFKFIVFGNFVIY